VETRSDEQATLGTKVIVVEAALLFEAEWQDMFDEVWLVEAPREAVLQRLRDRGVDNTEAERRLASATDPARAREQATRVLDNDGNLDDLRHKVTEALQAVTGGS
jgi:dephospho-CoA kinase